MMKLKLTPMQGEKPANLIAYADCLNSRYFSVAFSEGGGPWPV